ncbi:hypothetical protein I4U23_000863 [Adineta vaga]|nr:hypothetical protein I4U23_000863 [Adineta vaga]
MTSITSPIIRTKSLINFKQFHANTQLKSTLSNAQSILPNYPLHSILQKRHSKKRVRFELKLESVQEESSSVVNQENSVVPPTNRISNTWQDIKLLQKAYVKALEKPTLPKTAPSGSKRPSRPSLSPDFDNENSFCSRSFIVENRSPQVVIDFYAVTTPPFYLPTVLHRQGLTSKKLQNSDRKHSLTSVDSSLKQRIHLSTPPRSIPSRKPTNSFNDKKFFSPIVKRIDLTLPTMKDLHPNEKLIRIDNSSRLKMIKEHLQSKKNFLG